MFAGYAPDIRTVNTQSIRHSIPLLLGSGYSSILIPRLPVFLTSLRTMMWHRFKHQVCRKRSRLVTYTSLAQVEMNKDNIIWQGNGWPVSVLYWWVKKWAATAIHALCLWVSQRRKEKKRSGRTAGKKRERDEVGERWQEIHDKRQRRHGWGGVRGKQLRKRWYITGIFANPICIVSRSVVDNVSSFPLCQIFTVHLRVSLPALQSRDENKRWAEGRHANKEMALISYPPIPLARLQQITESMSDLARQA